jgi:maltooligosyltrehalose trehalohydrolase
MESTGQCWWEARVQDANPGTDYCFSVDGSKPVPDPRSRWQPYGVHGPSRLVRDDFAWTDREWNPPPLASAIIYELHIGTFTPEGTFLAAIEKLNAIVELGVTHIELMPVAEFPGKWGWGYDGVDLFAPFHHYGSPEDLKTLVNACHERGLAVLLDVVYNHFGPDGNYLETFGPYATRRYETPWGKAVNLDGPMSEGVREFFIANTVMWLRDYHFDGLRLDAVHALIDHSALHFLEQLSRRVKTLEAETGRHLTLIAESDLNDPRIVRGWEAGGYGIDAQCADDFHHALHTLLIGEKSGYYEDFGEARQLAKALEHPYVYDGCYSRYRKREHGRRVEGIAGYRFVVCAQNHDQVGNRAKGERLSHLAGIMKAKMAAVVLMTSPYVPLIFQGEEWAASTPFHYFTQHEDSELGRKVSEGRRKEFSSFGWDSDEIADPQDSITFERSKLNWSERNQGEHAEMLAWYRSLISLRRSTPELVNGDFEAVQVQFSEHESWVMLKRDQVVVLCNFGTKSWLAPGVDGEVLLASAAGSHMNREGVMVPPASAVILMHTSRGEASSAGSRAAMV